MRVTIHAAKTTLSQLIERSHAGDDVVIVGEQGGESIGVREIAAAIGTIPYELLCRLGARIQRVYE